MGIPSCAKLFNLLAGPYEALIAWLLFACFAFSALTLNDRLKERNSERRRLAGLEFEIAMQFFFWMIVTTKWVGRENVCGKRMEKLRVSCRSQRDSVGDISASGKTN